LTVADADWSRFNPGAQNPGGGKSPIQMCSYPTDIRAGFELGTNIFVELSRNSHFTADLNESKDEIDIYLAGFKKAINVHEEKSQKRGAKR